MSGDLPSCLAPGKVGRVVRPGDQDYDKERKNYNTRLDRRPMAMVFCETADHVERALRCVRDNHIPFRVRSGRHSYEEFSLMDNGIVIDVSQLRGFKHRHEFGEHRVSFGAGFGQRELWQTLAESGLAFPTGTAPDVGIAGVLQGGGIGMMTRQLGLALDNLVSVELVTPACKQVKVGEYSTLSEHKDLFWAIRGGGGGNFGIITGFTVRAQELRQVSVYQMCWTYDQLTEVLDAWQKWAPDTDRHLTCQLTVHPRKHAITSEGLFLGEANDLETLLRQWPNLPAPTNRWVMGTSYLDAAEFFAQFDEIEDHPFKTSGAFVYQNLPPDGLTQLKEQLDQAPDEKCGLWMQSFGGRMGETEPTATAFFHRGARFIFEYSSEWDPQEKDDPKRGEDACTRWVEGLRQAMVPYTRGTYVNFVDRAIENWQEVYYGDNLPRLKGIRKAVDPENLFNFEQSIPNA